MSLVTSILLLRASTLQEFATMLLNYRIGCFILALLCVGVRVQFG